MELLFKWQNFQKEFTIFINLFKKQICDAHMFTCHMILFPPATSSPLMGAIDAFVIVLQLMYLKSFTHQSTVSHKKSHVRTKAETFVLTLYWISVRAFLMHLANPITIPAK
jgi:hypothetical protein